MLEYCDELDPDLVLHVRTARGEDAPPIRRAKAKSKGQQDRRRRKHQARPRKGFDPRAVRAALQGMLLGFDRLAGVLDGEALARARGAFQVGGDHPGIARGILGWPESVDVVADRTIKPPWED